LTLHIITLRNVLRKVNLEKDEITIRVPPQFEILRLLMSTKIKVMIAKSLSWEQFPNLHLIKYHDMESKNLVGGPPNS
jgi:hypothetical protein